jgi:nitrate reductase gamma subunit
MMPDGLVYLVTYGSLVVFVAAIAIRVIRYLRTPLHLRWELYPVAHEKGRAHYGGSRLEELEWWTKPGERSLLGELKVMLPEILVLRTLWENNRSLWLRSFPFHFGLYLLAGFIGLLLVGALTQLAGVIVGPDTASAVGSTIHVLTVTFGVAGLGLAIVGSAGLLHRRLTDEDLRDFTTAADVFNLVFFLFVLLVAATAWLTTDRSFVALRDYAQNLITFHFAPVGSRLVMAETLLGSLLIAYIPLTHMSHFFMKYFLYHHIRWDDEANGGSERIERATQKALDFPIRWSAAHIQGDGKKTWKEAATEDVP